MLKVLITSAEVDIPLDSLYIPSNIITWFEASYVSANPIETLIWSKYEPLPSPSDESVEMLKQGESFCVIPIKSIVRIDDTSQGSNLHLTDKSYISTNLPLDLLEEVLANHNFFRVHTNHLINLHHMKSLVQCSAFVTLSNSDAIPVGAGDDQKIIDFLNQQTII